MTSLKNHFLRSSTALYLFASSATTALAINIGTVPPGLGGGEGETTIVDTVTGIVVKLLTLMALIATIVIIIAGVRLVISQGEESAVEKAKKTIIWAVAGLILIILAGAIVSFVGSSFSSGTVGT
ncbi:MAG: hypothetical protein K9M03_03720 [Kiritimatiellales bacterium]|nr:hypothetical protein [Kiritimatiellales bacterium]